MVGVGILGFGYWGPNLARNFWENSKCSLVSIADLRREQLSVAAARYPGVHLTTDLAEILSNLAIDAVALATPVDTHFDLGMAVLGAGKHLWIEKPMTETSAQAKKLAAEASRRGLVLFVDHTFIYTGAVRQIKKTISSGDLGQTYYYDSTRINLGMFQSDVNVISDLAVHDFSILDYLIGLQPVAVSATGRNHFDGAPENLAYITLHYQNGFIAHINVSWLAPLKVRRILIGGSKKMITYDDLEPSEKIKIYDKGVVFTDDPEQIQEMRVGYRVGDMWAPKIDRTEALQLATDDFFDSILTGQKPLTDALNGIRVVEIIEAATASMRAKGATICLQPMEIAA